MAEQQPIVLELPPNFTSEDVKAQVNDDFITKLTQAINNHGDTALVAAKKKFVPVSGTNSGESAV